MPVKAFRPDPERVSIALTMPRVRHTKFRVFGSPCLCHGPTPLIDPWDNGGTTVARSPHRPPLITVAAGALLFRRRRCSRQRLEKVIKEYPRAPVIPEALSLLADVNFSEGRDKEAVDLLRQVANDYSYTEFGKRAAQRLRAQR